MNIKLPKLPNIHGLLRQGMALARKNTPVILTATAVTGVVVTSVLTAKAAPKAAVEIAAEEAVSEAPKTKPEAAVRYVKATWKTWIPPVVSGALTITSIVFIHYTHQKRYAALMGLYVLGDKAFQEYRETIEEVVDKSTGQKIREKAAEKAVNRDKDALEDHLVNVGETHLVYDSFTGRYFKSDIETIRRAVNEFNHLLNIHGYSTLNELYSLMGVGYAGCGEDMGWNADKLVEIGIESVLTDKGQPAIHLDFYQNPPTHDYYKNH